MQILFNVKNVLKIKGSALARTSATIRKKIKDGVFGFF